MKPAQISEYKRREWKILCQLISICSFLFASSLLQNKENEEKGLEILLEQSFKKIMIRFCEKKITKEVYLLFDIELFVWYIAFDIILRKKVKKEVEKNKIRQKKIDTLSLACLFPIYFLLLWSLLALIFLVYTCKCINILHFAFKNFTLIYNHLKYNLKGFSAFFVG